MKLTNRQIDALFEMLSLTSDREIGCDDCLKRMAEFAEVKLEGKSVPESLAEIERHLEQCGECSEEYEALKRALQDFDGTQD